LYKANQGQQHQCLNPKHNNIFQLHQWQPTQKLLVEEPIDQQDANRLLQQAHSKQTQQGATKAVQAKKTIYLSET
jgi:hypothetical protein